MRLRPRTRLYSVTDEGPRMRRRCGRWSIGLACTDESSSSSCCYPYIKNAKVGDREQGKLTLKFGSSSSSLRPCHSPCTTQVCATHAALLKKSLRRCPVVTLELAHRSARLWVKWRIYLVRERLKCSDVLPGAQTHGRARRMPRHERRKPRSPCSEAGRRWNMQRPHLESLVK